MAGAGALAGAVSSLGFTILHKNNEPPRELIGHPLPVTGVFTLVTAALLSIRYRPGWSGLAEYS